MTRGRFYAVGNHFTLRDQQVIDWYDGIVQAIARPEDEENWYLVGLVAWDMRRELKAYVLLPISHVHASALATALSETAPSSEQAWATIQVMVDAAIAASVGQALAIVCKDIGRRVLAVVQLDRNDVSNILLSAEEALAKPRVARWIESLLPDYLDTDVSDTSEE